jgi:hypothetical protein
MVPPPGRMEGGQTSAGRTFRTAGRPSGFADCPLANLPFTRRVAMLVSSHGRTETSSFKCHRLSCRRAGCADQCGPVVHVVHWRNRDLPLVRWTSRRHGFGRRWALGKIGAVSTDGTTIASRAPNARATSHCVVMHRHAASKRIIPDARMAKNVFQASKISRK